jgi:hypothetical protein
MAKDHDTEQEIPGFEFPQDEAPDFNFKDERVYIPSFICEKNFTTDSGMFMC